MKETKTSKIIYGSKINHFIMEKIIYQDSKDLLLHVRDKSGYRNCFYLVLLFFLCLLSARSSAETIAARSIFLQSDTTLTVRGRILNNDEPAQPISDVSVFIKDSDIGVKTDMEGRFSINARRGDVLVFSLVGHKRQEY